MFADASAGLASLSSMIKLAVVALMIAAAISVLIESSNITLIRRAREQRTAEASKAGEAAGSDGTGQ